MASTYVARAFLKTDDPKHDHLVGTVELDSARNYYNDAEYEYVVGEVEAKYGDWGRIQIVEIPDNKKEKILEILTKD